MKESIRLNIKPLSINDAYRGRRFVTPEYEKYKSDVAFLLPRKIELPEPPYQIHFKFGFSSMSSDWDNCVKTTQDSIAKKYGFNDKLIKRGIVEVEQVKKGKEFFEFQITSLNQLP